MLPDMSSVLSEWSQAVTLKTVTATLVDYEPSTSVATSSISAVIQPTSATTLKALDLDIHLEHITAHAKVPVVAGQYIEYNGKDYKAIHQLRAGDYGFWKVICEEVKGNLI